VYHFLITLVYLPKSLLSLTPMYTACLALLTHSNIVLFALVEGRPGETSGGPCSRVRLGRAYLSSFSVYSRRIENTKEEVELSGMLKGFRHFPSPKPVPITDSAYLGRKQRQLSFLLILGDFIGLVV